MIYYDITDIIEYFSLNPQATGIERVSLATIRQMQSLCAEGEVELIAYHPRYRKPVCCALSSFPLRFSNGAEFSACVGSRNRAPSALDGYVARRYPARTLRVYHKWRLAAANIFSRGRTFRQRGIPSSVTQEAPPKVEWRTPCFAKGDVVVFSGGRRTQVGLFAEVRKLRGPVGLTLVQLVHDVLPLSHPQFYLPGDPQKFSDWLLAVHDCFDHIITTTFWNKTEIESEMKKRQKSPLPITVIPLAHEFIEDPEDRKRPVYEVVSTPVLSSCYLPYVLCVGTREIRKNNIGLARLWPQLKARSGQSFPRLVFAGRRGWMNEEFDDFLAKTDHADRSIIVLDSPSEAELSFLYRNCLFTVFPSYAEGWGLPIGESLWFDRPVVASRATGMPEVAGEFVEYVDPYAPESIEAAVELMLDPEFRQQRSCAIRAMPKRSWRDFATDLLNRLRDLSASAPAPQESAR